MKLKVCAITIAILLTLILLLQTKTPSTTHATPQLPRWLVGGENGQLMATDCKTVENLTASLGTTFDIKVIKNGFGFYLIGLEDEPLGLYEGPGAGARIVKYDGVSFTNVAPSVEGVQIMEIVRYRSKFLIGGYYKASGHSYPYARLYTYDGVTFEDVTDEVFGSHYFNAEILCMADCENYWLIGARIGVYGWLYKWDGETLTTLMEWGVIPNKILWTGEYAYIACTPAAGFKKYNGTHLTQVENFPTYSVWDMEWNGTHALIAVGEPIYETEHYLLCYDTLEFTYVRNGTKWYDISWNGEYWMLAGGQLYAFDGESTWTDYTSLKWFLATALCPGALIVYVTSEPEISVAFQFAGKTYRTPVVVVCYPGSYSVAVVDTFPIVNDTRHAFIYMSYTASPPIDIYSSATTLTVSKDSNLTLYYFVGAYHKPSPPVVPPEELMMPCFPLTFYIIMVILFFAGLYLYAKRELWLISIPLIPVIAWLLWRRPCPPYDFYIAIVLAIIAVGLLLNKLRRK